MSVKPEPWADDAIEKMRESCAAQLLESTPNHYWDAGALAIGGLVANIDALRAKLSAIATALRHSEDYRKAGMQATAQSYINDALALLPPEQSPA